MGSRLLASRAAPDRAAVPHGFRSSFRDWAAAETDHPREVIEAALAHVVQNRVAAALNSRPRKTLGWRTPAETLEDLLSSKNQTSTLR